MATEYKLSYTASEIDERLGRVDSLVSTINGISPDVNGNINIEVQGVEVTEIIDVTTLPTENIDNRVSYRVLAGTFISKGMLRQDSVCHIVNWESSPTGTGESALKRENDEFSVVGYYNIKNNIVYGYFDNGAKDALKAYVDSSSLSSTLKFAAKTAISLIPTGWKTMEEIIGILNNDDYKDFISVKLSYGGVINSKKDAIDENAIYLYLYNEMYINRNGSWIKLNPEQMMYGTGNGSEIFNYAGNKASGNASHAEGFKTEATGLAAHSKGIQTEALGDASHSEGRYTHAIGIGSHAEGASTRSIGVASHAEGSETNASGVGAHAEGYSTNADGNYSHAEGRETYALKDYSHAEGYHTLAKNEAAHSEGKHTKAVGIGSHVEGFETEALGEYSHAEGRYTKAVGIGSHAEGAGNHAIGLASHAEGDRTISSGVCSHSGGFKSIACGNYGFAHGKNVGAGINGLYFKAIDFTNKYIFLSDSKPQEVPKVFDEGKEGEITYEEDGVTPYRRNTVTFGKNYENFGYNNLEYKAVFYFSETWSLAGNGWWTEVYEFDPAYGTGYRCYTSDGYEIPVFDIKVGDKFSIILPDSHHILCGTVSKYIDSHAVIQYEEDSLGFNSLSDVYGTQDKDYIISFHKDNVGYLNIGNSSHAEGCETFAIGDYSHAEGCGTIATIEGQHVEGKYNSIDGNEYIHVLGNGESNTDRSNAHTIDKNGNAWFAGDVYVGKDNLKLADTKDIPYIAKYGSTDYATLISQYNSNKNILLDIENYDNGLEAGLYDTSGNLLKTWDELLNTKVSLDRVMDGLGKELNAITVTNGILTSAVYYSTTSNFYFNASDSLLSDNILVVDNSVHTIGTNAFAHLYLTGIILPSSVTTIQSKIIDFDTRSDNSNYKRKPYLVIPNSVVNISPSAFYTGGLTDNYDNIVYITIYYNGIAEDVNGDCWSGNRELYTSDTSGIVYYTKVNHLDYSKAPFFAKSKHHKLVQLDMIGNHEFRASIVSDSSSTNYICSEDGWYIENNNKLPVEDYIATRKTITNLILEENIICGKLFVFTTKTWVDNAAWDSVKINCKANDNLFIKYINDLSTSGKLSVSYFDIDGNYVNNSHMEVAVPAVFTVPNIDTIAYAYIPINHQFKDLVSIYNTNEPTELVIPYGKTAVLEDIITKWHGKTWYAYGTSITEENNTNKTGKYTKFLADLSGMNLTNRGIGSNGITSGLGGYSGNTGQVKTAIMTLDDGKAEADLITLEVGANDFKYTDNDNLGNVFDTGDDTFCGCLNQCIQYLQANTSAQILIISSPYSAYEDSDVYRLEAIYKTNQKVAECCMYNDVHYLCPSNNLGRAKLSAGQKKYTRNDGTTIHQSGLGGYIYASNIWEKIKTMPLFY